MHCIHAQNIEVDYECKRSTDMTDRITYPIKAFGKIIIVCTKPLTIYSIDKSQLSQTNPRDGKVTSGQSSLT